MNWKIKRIYAQRMRVKMTEYDFIVQEPWLFEDYIMPDIERNMIIRMINTNSGELFPFCSAHKMMIDTLEYYKEQKLDFYIQIESLPNTVRMRLISLLVSALGIQAEKFVTIIQHNMKWFTILFEDVEDENGEKVVDLVFIQDETLGAEPAFVLEFLGHKELDANQFEYLTVLYDRLIQKHGFVRLRDSDYVDGIEDLLREAYCDFLNDALNHSEESEAFDEEEGEEEEE